MYKASFLNEHGITQTVLLSLKFIISGVEMMATTVLFVQYFASTILAWMPGF
jgi:hypothetical protein